MKIQKANRGEAGGGQARCENQYRLRSSCVILRVGMRLRQYVHFYFLHGVRVHCAPEIFKRGPDPPKRNKPVGATEGL